MAIFCGDYTKTDCLSKASFAKTAKAVSMRQHAPLQVIIPKVQCSQRQSEALQRRQKPSACESKGLCRLLYRRYNVLKGKAKLCKDGGSRQHATACSFEVIITRFPLAGNAFFCKETPKRRLLRIRTGGQRSGGRCFCLWGRILRSSELFESMYMKWSLRNFPIYAEYDEPAQPKTQADRMTPVCLRFFRNYFWMSMRRIMNL